MKHTTILFVAWIFATLGISASNYDTKHIETLLSKMTLEEKVKLIVGTETEFGIDNHKVAGAAGFTAAIDRLGIPSLNLADGPVGVRIHPCPANKNYGSYATAFPSSSALAATWNLDLARLEGEAIGAEAFAYGVDVVLTPGINIMRNPLCGRNFEYLSEDPVLGGLVAAAMINGIQSKGVGTSLKHFVANNQQINKLNNDSRIPPRALREIYLKGFEVALANSDPWTIMASYNKIGGVYAQTNKELLTSLLRDEWKYKGLIMTDWYKTRCTVDQLSAGIDLLMPGEKQQYDELIKAVNNGTLSEKRIDNAVRAILNLVGKSLSSKGWKYDGAPDLKANGDLSRSIASEGMVLLKNEESLLPLRKETKVALFGVSAYHSIAGGGGSSNVNKAKIVDVCAGMENAGFVLNDDIRQMYSCYNESQKILLQKNVSAADWERLSYFRVVVPEMNVSKADAFIRQQAVNSDVAVVVIGRSSTEEADRRLKDDYYLSENEKNLIIKVSDAFKAENKKVVVVLNVCGVVETASWEQCADAVLLAWLPGQECGNAVADIISGRINPSGKLPMTFPVDYSDLPSSKNYPLLGKEKSGRNFDYTNYEEDIWVGYRYFSTVGEKVSYPFGFGLSYTTFEYSNAGIKKVGNKWKAVVTVRNTGKCSGKEVVQLYVKAPVSNMVMPERELKAFAKTRLLAPGESQTLEMSISECDLASYSPDISSWVVSKGDYLAQFAASCDDIRLTHTFRIPKNKTWKTLDLLRTVEPVEVFNPVIKK